MAQKSNDKETILTMVAGFCNIKYNLAIVFYKLHFQRIK